MDSQLGWDVVAVVGIRPAGQTRRRRESLKIEKNG